MGFSLDDVVPWGRNAGEYAAMFALTDADCAGRILGCADGPASFNAELTRRGCSVVSIDPLYAFDGSSIRRRIDDTAARVIGQARANRGDYVWTSIPDPEALLRIRMNAMECFLADYDAGLRAGRYIAASLPELPFADGTFALALASHFLFLYGAMFDAEFHVDAIRAMCRVAAEARVFPLLELDGKPSRHLEATLAALNREGYETRVTVVEYEFQRGGNRMLSVRRKADDVS